MFIHFTIGTKKRREKNNFAFLKTIWHPKFSFQLDCPADIAWGTPLTQIIQIFTNQKEEFTAPSIC